VCRLGNINPPRWCWVHSPQPVARVRPLLDLLSLLPLRAAARDLCSGSGLTANRTNLLNASELCLAFDWVSRSARPALCYRPLLAFPPHFAMLRVTELEPRTLHQPELDLFYLAAQAIRQEIQEPTSRPSDGGPQNLDPGDRRQRT